MTLEERIYNADRAREVLENEAYLAAFADTKQELMTAWENSPARDLEGREKLWLMLSLLKKLEKHLSTSLDTGKLARLDLEHKRTLAEHAKALIGRE